MKVDSDPNALPAGCVRCEYLESTGTQWIDTEYHIEIGDEIFIKNVLSKYENTYYSLLSSGIGDYQTILLTIPGANGYFYKYFATGDAVKIYYDDRNIHHIRIANDGRLCINDTEVGTSHPISQTNTQLFLLKRANNSYYWVGTIGDFIISKNGEDVLHLLPILDQEGVPCMYDTVNKQFHYNKGTGQFLYKILEQ
jgi:hypothetical protein